MPTFARRCSRKATTARFDDRLNRLERLLGKLTRARVNVLERHTRDLETQFKRIAQIQADLDTIQPACARSKVR